MLDVAGQFPVLTQQIHGQRLAYLDSAASTQKPLAVIEAMNDVLRNEYSNVHRGVHDLSQRLSARFEAVRETVAQFIHAPSAQDIVFTKGTTDALNLLASSLGQLLLKPGDKVLISAMEHHANIVPWQLACQRFGAELVVLPINGRSELCVEQFDDLLNGVKIVSLVHVSNVLGTVNDIQPLLAKAKAQGAVTIVDGAQAIAHLAVDVQALDCDFYAFSAHKLYGPTAAGVLYGRRQWLEAMPPYQGGGDMILSVSFDGTEYAAPPHKFEAGTPAIVEVIGMGAAIDWWCAQDRTAIIKEENRLARLAEQDLLALGGIRLIGTAVDKAAVVSFVVDGVHPHDVGTVLDQHGVAVRVGQHCAEPLMQYFGITATVRASFAAYSVEEDVVQLINAVKATKELFL